MSTHRIETRLNEDGKLVLEDLPFQAGDMVEVTIVENKSTSNGDSENLIIHKSKAEPHAPTSYPLRGTVVKYEAPTEPVGVEEWNAGK